MAYYAMGISLLSLCPGAPVKVKVVSSDGETYSEAFTTPIGIDLPSTFSEIIKCSTKALEEIKGATLSVPSHFEDKERCDIKAAAQAANLTVLRVVTHGRAVLNGMEKGEDSTQNELVVEVGPTWASSHLFTTEVDSGYRFPELQTHLVMEGTNLEASPIFEALVRPMLEWLTMTPTEYGSKLKRMVIVDASTGDDVVGPAFYQLSASLLAQENVQIIQNSSFLDYTADLALELCRPRDLNSDFICVFNVVVLNIGVAKADGFVVPIIIRHRTIPAQGSAIFTTFEDNQTQATIHLVVGMGPRVMDNVRVGELTISGITPQPKGSALVKVSVDVDCEEATHIVAEELGADGHPLFNGAKAAMEMACPTGTPGLGVPEVTSIVEKYASMKHDEEAEEAENVWACEIAQGALPG